MVWAVCVVVFSSPLVAWAARGDDDEVKPNARYAWYKGVNVGIENRSVTVLWLVLIGLIILGLISLFKNAKRTHLD